MPRFSLPPGGCSLRASSLYRRLPPMPPHNMPLTILGAGMLWVGWFGFNGGSVLAANSAAAIWCAIGTYVILKVLQAAVGLRVSEDHEREGLDLSQHGERAYIE